MTHDLSSLGVRLPVRQVAPLFLAIVAGACGGGPPAPQAPQVTVAEPERRTVQSYGEFTGTTRAVESVEIRARVAGTLEEIRFEPSRPVRSGQVLFVIEREPYLAARDEALGSLRSAEAELARAESDLRRVEQAIQTNAVSQSDLDRAQATRDQAEAAVLAARGRLANAELNLEYTLVRSPIDGMIGRWFVDPGNLVGATGPTHLATVNALAPIYVYFEAAEDIVLAFLAARSDSTQRQDRVGRVQVALANETDFPHEGAIDFIDNTVDPATGTIELRAVLPNADGALFPGLFVRIRVVGREKPNALVVREQAIGTDLGGKYVLVVGEGDVVDQRYVTLGPRQDDGTIEVTDGLDGMERYIVNGMLRARPGFPVTPQSEADVAAAQQDAAPAEEN
jgi:RND family efflux transporter MFP subunit